MKADGTRDSERPRGQAGLVLAAAVICAALVAQVALAGGGPDRASVSAGGTAKQLKKLRGQVAVLSARLDAVESRPGGASGAAGGDLTGTYPNPEIAAGAVGGPEVDEAGLDTSILQARLAPGIPFPCSANNGAMYNVIQSGGVGCTSAVGNTKAVKVTFAGTQAIPSGTPTAVNFTSEIFDTAALHDNATNPHLLSPPVAAAGGIYLVSGDIELPGTAAGTTRTLCIIGQVLSQAEACVREEPTASFNHRMSVSTVAVLGAGEAVRMTVFQDSGGSLNLTGDNLTELSMVRISAGVNPGSAVTGL